MEKRSTNLRKPINNSLIGGCTDHSSSIESKGDANSEGKTPTLTMEPLMPFVISLGFVLLDYLTTTIGLSRGFYETHSNYSPINALLIFWGAIALLSFSLPKTRFWRLCIVAFSTLSCLGALNNIMVLCGVFGGLVI